LTKLGRLNMGKFLTHGVEVRLWRLSVGKRPERHTDRTTGWTDDPWVWKCASQSGSISGQLMIVEVGLSVGLLDKDVRWRGAQSLGAPRSQTNRNVNSLSAPPRSPHLAAACHCHCRVTNRLAWNSWTFLLCVELWICVCRVDNVDWTLPVYRPWILHVSCTDVSLNVGLPYLHAWLLICPPFCGLHHLYVM